MQLSSLLFVWGSIALLLCIGGGFLYEQAGLLPKQSVYAGIAQVLRRGVELYCALKSKVPDELEMQHRLVCISR